MHAWEPPLGAIASFQNLGSSLPNCLAHWLMELKNLTLTVLPELFEATEEISYQTLWNVPLISGKAALVSCLNVDFLQGFAKIDHSEDSNFIEPPESAQICQNNPLVHEAARIFIAIA
jgi:hypothetical protein